MKPFAHFVHNFNPAQAAPRVDFAKIAKDLMSGKQMDSLPANPEGMRMIAGGPNSADPSYTEILMKAWKARSPIYWDIDGISLHQYNFGEQPFAEPASGFGEREYARVLMQTQAMERTVSRHAAIMDTYDPKKHVALVVDEWGVWLKPTEGTEPMFLMQQNSLRDGLAAALTINIFARHADRVRMTNIAQMINVLQAMILTDGPKMVLTPTYHVYKLYVPFQDATFLPVTFNAGQYKFARYTLPRVDALAARGKDGKVWLALVNLDPNAEAEVTAKVPGVVASKAVGQVLTAASFGDVNTFDAPAAVAPKPFSAAASNGSLTLKLAPHSLTVVSLEP
jgi:alpha-N-arabinofuranosidase